MTTVNEKELRHNENMNQKDTLILCRVSSKEQEESGYSLDAQEKLLTDYGQHKIFNIVRIFRIAESASGKQVRKIFNEMLQYATKNNVHIILCEKIDRLTRNLKDAATISDWVQENELNEVHFVKENFVVNKNTRAHENLVWDMKVAIARFYANNLSEEVRKGQKEKLSQGWLPTKPPLGYRTIGDKGHKIHEIDGEKAPFIRKMFELYSTGNYSTIALSNAMFKEGFRNRIGKKVGKSRTYDLLRDSFYIGQMKWKGMIYKANHEPLISKELYDRVQVLLSRTLSQPQQSKLMSVFKSKMTCEVCGGTITWETHKGHWYGHCSGYQRLGMKKKCDQRHVFFRQEKIEEQIFPFFDKVTPISNRVLEILEQALKESHADEISRFNTNLNELNATIERSQRRLEAVYEDKLDGKVSVETYERLFKQYTQQKEDAVRELTKLNTGNKKYYEAGYAIHELALKAKEIYNAEKTTDEDRRMLLSYVFSNIPINGLQTKPVYTLAFNFLANWVPKINNILELEKTLANKRQKGTFVPSHPILLRG
jgi:site-specific DNA recombinase